MFPKADVTAAANTRQFEDLLRGTKRIYACVQHFFVWQRVHKNLTICGSRWHFRPPRHLELIYVYYRNPKFFFWFVSWRLTTLR